MKNNTVVLTKRFLTPAIERLQRQFNLIIVEDGDKSTAEVLKENPDTRALIPFLSDPVGKDIIDLGENLQIIANYAVGYNNIDFAHALQKGIYVTHTPDILTNATADLAMALVLAVCRRMVESDEFVRRGEFLGWGANLMLGKELNGSTMGIIGMGRIGLATALRAQSFGMKIVYYSKTRRPELESRHGFEYLPFLDLVRRSDIISPHIPYDPDVHHLFNKEVFDMMKPDAVFINTARGALMDEAYLAEKLAAKELFGAGLDVYEFEPRVHQKLVSLPNVVLTPHTGSATYTARLGMANMAVDGVIAALSGSIPDFLIPEWRRNSK